MASNPAGVVDTANDAGNQNAAEGQALPAITPENEKTYNETYVRFTDRSKNEKGEIEIDQKPLPESKANKLIESAKADVDAGKRDAETMPSIDRQITAIFHEVVSPDGILELVPNETEACNLFNRGVVLKQQMAIRDYVMDDDFAIPDGPLDLRADCAELHERRKASPQEKAAKLLGIDPNELQALLAAFRSQNQPAAG